MTARTRRPDADAKRTVNRIFRSVCEIRISLDGERLYLEHKHFGHPHLEATWMLCFGEDFATSLSPEEAAALIAAANGPRTDLDHRTRVMRRSEYEAELEIQGGEEPAEPKDGRSQDRLA